MWNFRLGAPTGGRRDSAGCGEEESCEQSEEGSTSSHDEELVHGGDDGFVEACLAIVKIDDVLSMLQIWTWAVKPGRPSVGGCGLIKMNGGEELRYASAQPPGERHWWNF